MSATTGPEGFDHIEALQNALRAEHAAVYGYGFVGANSGDAARKRAYEHLDAHRGQRDTLRAELLERDADPAAGERAYELPAEDGPDALAQFAAGLERTAAQAYLELAAAGDPELRDLAGRSLKSTTVRSLAWGADLMPFPGFPGGEL
ncbi:rubrerythrin [Spinactinospora alkalitolerans]|uniref:Rubrerythrin n=1 Tax=Spinactinospora alkalitolerans TaxID=687207 RepID=A0A852TP50_9ACTN|nr:ferritin-like domain-containing protein [Spinactinospora alkalitolerans]NYE46136.1 rubrerythrin [Spinactinospora alkalitolerans]